MVDPEEVKRIVEERGVTPCQAFFATFLAAFHASGVLSQGVVNLVATHAAETLQAYLRAMNLLKVEGSTPAEKMASLIDSVLSALEWGEWRVEPQGDRVVLRVKTSKCRYCPKGVGRGQLPGTACPLPKLIERLANLEGIHAQLVYRREKGRVSSLEKSGGECVIEYRVS